MDMEVLVISCQDRHWVIACQWTNMCKVFATKNFGWLHAVKRRFKNLNNLSHIFWNYTDRPKPICQNGLRNLVFLNKFLRSQAVAQLECYQCLHNRTRGFKLFSHWTLTLFFCEGCPITIMYVPHGTISNLVTLIYFCPSSWPRQTLAPFIMPAMPVRLVWIRPSAYRNSYIEDSALAVCA